MRLALVLFISWITVSNGVELSFEPENLKEFRVGETRLVQITVNETDFFDAPLDVGLSVECDKLEVCRVESVTKSEEYNENNSTAITYNVSVKAVFLGITQLNVVHNNQSIGSSAPVRVLRAAFYVTLATVFAVVIGVFVTGVTFMMGTQLEWAKIRTVLRTPIGPSIGFVCQFVLMPLTGYILAEVGLNDDDMVLKLALFAASTCPGGGKSSFWTIIYGGNLDLSVAMTFTQTLAALFMMPFWLSTLGKRFTTERVDVPFVAIIEGLFVLLIPSALGMYFIHKKPHLVKRMEKYIKRCTWFATIFFTIFGVLANWYVFFLFTWRTVIIGCMLPWSGYIIAYLTARMFKQSAQDRITIAIETGIQNVGIATILMMWSLPEPEVDFSLTILFTIMLATDKPLILLWLASELRKRYWGPPAAETSETKLDAIDEKKEVHKDEAAPVSYDSTKTQIRQDSVAPTTETPISIVL